MFTWPKLIKKPKGKHVLILAPHMDDEIIGCGGVICKHIQNGDGVAVIYFTCGDKGNTSFSSDSSLSKIRKLEIQASNAILGIEKSYFLDFSDSTNEDWCSKKDHLKEIYLKVNPDLVRIESELHRKMVYIAEYEGRSLTWQMIHLTQECIRSFEREHGPIELPDQEQ